MSLESMLLYIIYAVGAYALLSLTLFCFPQILHKRKKYRSILLEEALHSKNSKPLLIAHRGGAQEGLENVLPTFEAAVSLGCHMLEFDLQITKDGVVVVAHDDDLVRLCKSHKNISDLNYNDLPPFASEIEMHFSEEAYHNTTPNAKFPKLEEVFQKFPHTLMHVDVKIGSPLLLGETIRLVKKYNREDLTVIGGADEDKTAKLRELNPNILTCCSSKLYFVVVIAYFLGLLPFISLPFHFFSVSKLTVELERIFKNKSGPKARGFNFAELFVKLVNYTSKPLFRHLQKRGILAVWWVLNDPKDFGDALKKRVNGIMTDVPSTLKSYLEKHNKLITFPVDKAPLLEDSIKHNGVKKEKGL